MYTPLLLSRARKTSVASATDGGPAHQQVTLSRSTTNVPSSAASVSEAQIAGPGRLMRGLAGLLVAVILCASSATEALDGGELANSALAVAAHGRARLDGVEQLGIPKVALLFLTRGEMPHEPSWAAWLAAARWLVPSNHISAADCVAAQDWKRPEALERTRRDGVAARDQQLLFSIYVHPPPGFAGYPARSVFHGREIEQRVQVDWGGHSMVAASHLLVRAALGDTLNAMFALLCESSVPIYPPTVVYQQLVTEAKSRVSACSLEHMGREDLRAAALARWNSTMLPHIPLDAWRKSAQWVTLTRDHAQLVAEETLVLGLFEQHCTPPQCVGDEHYFPVLLAYYGKDAETTCWGNSVATRWSGGVHPTTFGRRDLRTELLLEMRQNVDDWVGQPPCRDQEAIWLAKQTFTKAAPGWGMVACPEHDKIVFNPTLLGDSHCTLFARKIAPNTGLQMRAVLTGCDARLEIAPRPTCSDRKRLKEIIRNFRASLDNSTNSTGEAGGRDQRRRRRRRTQLRQRTSHQGSEEPGELSAGQR